MAHGSTSSPFPDAHTGPIMPSIGRTTSRVETPARGASGQLRPSEPCFTPWTVSETETFLSRELGSRYARLDRRHRRAERDHPCGYLPHEHRGAGLCQADRGG